MQDIFKNIIPHHLSYASIIACTRVCHAWFRAFNPHLAIVREWRKEKTPQRFMNEALENGDLRLIEFAIDVLKVKEFDKCCIRSRKVYEQFRHGNPLPLFIHCMFGTSKRIKQLTQEQQWGDTKYISYQIEYGLIESLQGVADPHSNFIRSAIYADNVKILNECVASEFNRFDAEFAALCGSFTCLDYFLNLTNLDIRYRKSSFFDYHNFQGELFDSNVGKLVNHPRIIIDWNTVFNMSILNSSKKWFDESLKRINTGSPPSISSFCIRMCRTRDILMKLVDIYKNCPDVLELLRENGDKRVIEKINLYCL